jgi:hypothetical protein
MAIPYTSEQWSIKVYMHCPDLMSHSLMVESQDPDNNPNGISGKKHRALTLEE